MNRILHRIYKLTVCVRSRIHDQQMHICEISIRNMYMYLRAASNASDFEYSNMRWFISIFVFFKLSTIASDEWKHSHKRLKSTESISTCNNNKVLVLNAYLVRCAHLDADCDIDIYILVVDDYLLSESMESYSYFKSETSFQFPNTQRIHEDFSCRAFSKYTETMEAHCQTPTKTATTQTIWTI